MSSNNDVYLFITHGNDVWLHNNSPETVSSVYDFLVYKYGRWSDIPRQY